MTEQLKEIGTRLATLREIMELPVTEMAAQLKMDEAEYTAYENGERDFSFSLLYNAANLLGVDVQDLISGDSPKLSGCCLVRKGQGYEIFRRKAYQYRHLGFTFKDKKAEPFLVTVEPKDEKPTLHAHDGQEFNYMLTGSIYFYLGEQTHMLQEGDSVYFDSSVPHAMQAVGEEAAVFLAVVMK